MMSSSLRRVKRQAHLRLCRVDVRNDQLGSVPDQVTRTRVYVVVSRQECKLSVRAQRELRIKPRSAQTRWRGPAGHMRRENGLAATAEQDKAAEAATARTRCSV